MMLQEILFQLMADNITIPGGDNMSLWDLGVQPYETILGGFFWVILIGMMSFLIWVRTESIGPPMIFFTIANVVFGSLTEGSAAVLFWGFAVLGTAGIFFKAMAGRGR